MYKKLIIKIFLFSQLFSALAFAEEASVSPIIEEKKGSFDLLDDLSVDKIKKKLSAAKADEKGDLIVALLKKGENDTYRLITDHMRDLSLRQKMQISYYSRNVSHAKMAEILLAWYKNEKDEFVREYAAYGLGSQKEMQHLDFLKSELEKADLNQFTKKALQRSVEQLSQKNEKPDSQGDKK